MRIGINGSGQLVDPDLGSIVDAVVEAEADGFDSYWLAQTTLLDAQATLGLAGRQTSSIVLGTAVVPTWSRHPHAMAASALTAQAACGGRFVLGIGLSHRPVVEGRYKMAWYKPIRHMLDYLDVLLPLLESGASAHEGEIFSYVGDGARPTENPPRVMLAALGEQMLRIAGRRADGTILWCVGPTTIERQIKPAIEAAAADAGRPAPSIVCSLPVWVTDDPEPARSFVGAALANYAELPSYRAMLDIEGVHGVEDISLIGTRDEVTEGLGRIAAAGATDFTAVVMGGNPDELAATTAALLDART
jgi:5,10-methylenetetrahydromethanopterin reductase